MSIEPLSKEELLTIHLCLKRCIGEYYVNGVLELIDVSVAERILNENKLSAKSESPQEAICVVCGESVMSHYIGKGQWRSCSKPSQPFIYKGGITTTEFDPKPQQEKNFVPTEPMCDCGCGRPQGWYVNKPDPFKKSGEVEDLGNLIHNVGCGIRLSRDIAQALYDAGYRKSTP